MPKYNNECTGYRDAQLCSTDPTKYAGCNSSLHAPSWTSGGCSLLSSFFSWLRGEPPIGLSVKSNVLKAKKKWCQEVTGETLGSGKGALLKSWGGQSMGLRWEYNQWDHNRWDYDENTINGITIDGTRIDGWHTIGKYRPIDELPSFLIPDYLCSTSTGLHKQLSSWPRPVCHQFYMVWLFLMLHLAV